MSEEEALAEETNEEDTEKEDSGEEPPKKRSKKTPTKAKAAKAAKTAKAKDEDKDKDKDKDKDAKGKKKRKQPRKHPKTLEMVVEAVDNMNERGGSSVQAIKSYILQNFKTVRPDMVKTMMKRAFTQGLAKSVLSRPKGQSDTQVMSGRYLMGKSTLPDEDEVMPQQSKRAKDAQMLKAKKKPGKKGKKKKSAGAAKRPAKKTTKKRR